MANTDKDYNYIDEKAYDIASNRVPNNFKTYGNHNYKVIDIENNSTNGMQAYAVAPVKNGKADYNNVVISYAGTDSGDMKDILTDIETVGLGSKVIFEPKLSSLGPVPDIKGESQSVSADKFYQRVNKQIKQHGGVKAPTTSGHSLGGTLAMYIAAKHHLSATTFNGPDAWSMLTKKEREYIKTHPMDFMNYRNPKDIIGNITGNFTGSAKYVKSKTYFGSELVKQLEDVNDKLLNGSLKDKGLSTIASSFSLDIAAVKAALDYHSIDGWKFNKNGDILRVSGKTVNSKTNREFVKKYQQTRQKLLTSEAKLNAYYGS
ncbi:alpha/beta fold hydrolase, partial [Limosilactobacillus equigenerosi]|uniref:alpha/beta fold hydrolase n=1 Tax=Limosilactobacillus equigenerosi TaxID=417373 RepID=UPI0012E3FA45